VVAHAAGAGFARADALAMGAGLESGVEEVEDDRVHDYDCAQHGDDASQVGAGADDGGGVDVQYEDVDVPVRDLLDAHGGVVEARAAGVHDDAAPARASLCAPSL
jgi:hypothetical protein